MKKALSLVEVMVSIAIFSVVSVVSLNIYINNIKQSEQTKQFNVFLNEARFLRNFISEKLATMQIDYSEYFEQCVTKTNCPVLDGLVPHNDIEYGEKDGLYALQFLDFGTKPDGTPDNLGNGCIDNDGEYYEMPTERCNVIFAGSEDSPKGENPVLSSICADDKYTEAHLKGEANSPISNRACQPGGNTMNKLFLKDASGNKFIFGIKDFDDQKLLSLAILNPNPEVELDIPNPYTNYKCAKSFNCGAGKVLTNNSFVANNTSELYKGAVPISSLNLNISDFEVEFGPHQSLDLAPNQLTAEVQQAPFVHIKFFVEPKNKFVIPFQGQASRIPVEIYHVFDI